jgi:hypothetical protein
MINPLRAGIARADRDRRPRRAGADRGEGTLERPERLHPGDLAEWLFREERNIYFDRKCYFNELYTPMRVALPLWSMPNWST